MTSAAMARPAVGSGHQRLETQNDPRHQATADDVGQPVQRDVQHRDREHRLEKQAPSALPPSGAQWEDALITAGDRRHGARGISVGRPSARGTPLVLC